MVLYANGDHYASSIFPISRFPLVQVLREWQEIRKEDLTSESIHHTM